jgi:hypothetical protein
VTGTCLTVDGGLSLRGHPALLDDSSRAKGRP